jgi:hypothetical protein
MKNNMSKIAIGFCVVFFCAASVYGQSYDTCAHLKEWETANPQPGDEQIAKEQYDTVQLYIEKCPNDNESYLAFNDLSGAIGLFSTKDTTRFDSYRDWLISVLYLNTTDPTYFCACIYAMAGTYGYGKYHVPNATLAVLTYLQSHSNCGGPGLDKEINADIYDRHHEWETLLLVGDTTIEDTILPSLDKIGLGFLLNSRVKTPSSPLSSQYLASFTSSPNPFKKETTLQFALNRMTYITIGIYDELGRLVWGDGRGSSLEAGDHTIHLDATNFPSGTLYARISTGFGEVKTMKLVHEK